MNGLLLSLLALPLLMVAIDSTAGVVVRGKRSAAGSHRSEDFTILVPIWGRVHYLDNIDYLSDYGSRVLLCTTGDESAEFYTDLERISTQHGFRIFRDSPSRTATHRAQTTKQRSTSGTIRDRVIRNALVTVTTTYSIPLDADSRSTVHLSFLAGALEHHGLDIASIRLVPHNTETLLGTLQQFEYRLAMQYRFVAAWMVSGACHVAKTAVLRDVMGRHSLFFQGNDVETGLIAQELGYQVGHIPFEILTTVPSTFHAWWRQRLAWSGGEFRLFIVNARFVLRHPFFWLYGGLIAIIAFPLRWWTFSAPGWPLLIALGLYLALGVYLHWKSHSVWILLVPLYTLFSSLIMTPLGIIWYFRMAIKDDNFGIIRPQRIRTIS